ncbi:MAG TPA: thioredoxin-like domain-containing protein [Sunxiuqinia sp.]|nr:thioredoxin-like domain-containing protein [Sunxiuqinia sp.]
MRVKYTKSFNLLLTGLLAVFVAHARPCRIKIDFPTNKNDTILLTHYFNGKIYLDDTLKTDRSGKTIYNSQKALPQGIYQLYFNETKQIDFLVGQDQTFTIRLKDFHVQITGAKESKKFQNYVQFLAAKKEKARKLGKKMINKTALKQLNNDVQQYLQQEAKKSAGTFYGKFVASNLRIQPDASHIPNSIAKNDSLLWVYKHNYTKRHYWDHFDLNDIRMWRTPIINSRLNDYFNNVLIQLPDSVLPVAIRLIESSRKYPEVFENLVSYLLNNSVKSAYISMENVFVALAKKYYLSGDAFWATKKTMDKIREEVKFRENNLVGLPAKELFLEDSTGTYHSLYQQPTPFTVVVFWDPECGHCKKQIPQLYNDVFLNTDPSQLMVMAVYTQGDKKEWLKFIDEHGLDGWINVWDPNQISNFRVNYDVRTTPMIYLLDKDKKIIAKNLSIKTMKNLLNHLINQQP